VSGYTLRILNDSWPAIIGREYLFQFLGRLVEINLGLSFFNLLPIPPLDGSKILMGLLPSSKISSYLSIMRHASKIFLVLILVEWGFQIRIFSMLINPLWSPYAAFWLFLISAGR
jgi:Zn-dependent protease